MQSPDPEVDRGILHLEFSYLFVHCLALFAGVFGWQPSGYKAALIGWVQ